jgi:PAS domain S-box-containing protein
LLFPGHIIIMMDSYRPLSDKELLDILSLSVNATAIYTTGDIIIQSANDAMISIWGKDKSVIGRALEKALPELEGQPFISILKQVWHSGITYEATDTASTLLIDGILQVRYFDFIYQAMVNEEGKVYCILHTATDVTERHISRKIIEEALIKEDALLREQQINEELATSNEELAAINEELQHTQETLHELNVELEERVRKRTDALEKSEARARYLISDAPVAIGVFAGKDHVIESANNKLMEVLGEPSSIIGKPIYTALPELLGQPIYDHLHEVYITGEPFYGNEVKVLFMQQGLVNEVYCNLVIQPLQGSSGTISSIMLVATVVTEQVTARRIMEESEVRFRFLLNAMPQQVWTAKPDGILDYVNQIVVDDFRIDGKDIVGRGWQDFIHPDDLPGYLRSWDTALKSTGEFMYEFRLRFYEGVYRWHLGRALPLIEDGQVKLWLGTNTNIDIQKTNEHKKDEFLSIASHELKTPLTGIKAFNQLMRRTKSEEQQQVFIKKSADNILRLERLINDLLDVTKINAGKMNYRMEPFNFGQMVLSSVENIQHTHPSHQILIENSADIVYTGDHYRLEQVMQNFLSNAVKYSPAGDKVIVNSRVERESIVLSVQDFGIGIPEENMPLLFDRYYRVDNAKMQFEGLGLGLFISSEILKRHYGSFWIESEEGKGSTFYFRLPFAEKVPVGPISEKDGLYQDNIITVHYNQLKDRLDVNWTGFQNADSVRHGCMVMLDMVIQYRCYKIVNDNREVLGTWSDGADWVGKTFFPQLEKEGVKYLAWVFSSSVFSQLSAKKSIDVSMNKITTQFFTDISVAEEWTDQQRI